MIEIKTPNDGTIRLLDSGDFEFENVVEPLQEFARSIVEDDPGHSAADGEPALRLARVFTDGGFEVTITPQTIDAKYPAIN